MTINTDLVTAILVLVVTPLMGKLNQKFVDALKAFKLFADSTPAVKRSVALVGAAVISWLTATLGVHLSSTDITSLGMPDVIKVVLGLFTWLTSMYFHDTKPATSTDQTATPA